MLSMLDAQPCKRDGGLWVREHEREIWRKVLHIMLPKDYVCWRLLGGDPFTDGELRELLSRAQRRGARFARMMPRRMAGPAAIESVGSARRVV
jgi:hypothetical protein